jgi:23S rRNA (uracil-5-)-methyltransferase rumA
MAEGNNKRNIKASKELKCAVAKKCGGCDYINSPYDKHVKEKLELANKLIKKYGKFDGIISMRNPYHYRNKVSAVFGFENKKIIAGTYEKNSHRVVDTKNCLIEDKKASSIIQTIKKMCVSFKLKAYDEDSGFGFLRHVLIRVGKKSGQIMVVLVTSNVIFPNKNAFIKVLRGEHPEITTIVQNINNKNTSMVLGDREIVMYGKGYITDELCGLTFKISPKSFYQVNRDQTEKLYSQAIEYAGLQGDEVLLDAYSGIGTIGLIASKSVKEVISVELNKDAHKDAVTNAKINNIKNVKFYNADATHFINDLAAANEKIDVVILDPPRTGSTEEFIAAVGRLKPKKVVYVSCNPETLARDLEVFKRHKYRFEKGMVVDCFCHTRHVEGVVLLSKLDSKNHISVELPMNDMDLTSAESKATY